MISVFACNFYAEFPRQAMNFPIICVVLSIFFHQMLVEYDVLARDHQDAKVFLLF